MIALARARILHVKNKRVFSKFFIFYSFSTLGISLFIIDLINYSVTLYSTFYFLSFFYIATVDFSYICYLFSKLNHNSHEALQIFILFIMLQKLKTRHNFCINFLTSILSRPVFNTLLRDFS